MNQEAYDAIEKAWKLTVKARALCPYIDPNDPKAIGAVGYISPDWYKERGVVYFVYQPKPLTTSDINEWKEIGGFINRSFIISMAAILEVYCFSDYKKDVNDYVKLTKWLRNRFAHGKWEYDESNSKHVETRELLEKLFPEGAADGLGFVTSIDKILEPLKDGVLAYIKAAT